MAAAERGLELLPELLLALDVARRKMERNGQPRASQARKLAGLACGQVVFALGVREVLVQEYRLDEQQVRVLRESDYARRVLGGSGEVCEVADDLAGRQAQDAAAELAQ